jgi:hypothetical protein
MTPLRLIAHKSKLHRLHERFAGERFSNSVPGLSEGASIRSGEAAWRYGWVS